MKRILLAAVAALALGGSAAWACTRDCNHCVTTCNHDHSRCETNCYH